jgi:O-antigen ligase
MDVTLETLHSNGDGVSAPLPESRAIVVLLCAIAIGSVLLFGAVDSGTLTLLAITLFVIVGIWGWNAYRSGTFQIETNTLQIPILALFAIGLVQLLPLGGVLLPAGLNIDGISSSLSFDPYSTRFFLIRLFFYIVFFAASLTYLNRLSKLKTVTIILIAFGGLIAFYSILQRVETPAAIYGLREPPQAQPFGTYVNRHHFAALMEMTLGLTLGLIFAGRLRGNRLPFLIAAASVMAIAIVLTGSRGGMIGFLALLVFVAAAGIVSRKVDGGHDSERSGSSRNLAYAAGGAAFFLLTVGLTLFLGGADPLLRSAGIDPGAGDFTSGRAQFWQTALKIFYDHPIIGVGLDAFGAAYSRYDISSGALRVEQAHNDYLQILADAGILGFICVAVFIILLFRQGFVVIRDSSDDFRRGAAIGALAGCLGILIHSFFDFPLRTPANGFIFLLLVVTVVAVVEQPAAHRRRRRKTTPHELAV